jgi:hypothetical protein
MRGREDGWHMRHAGVDPGLGASEDAIGNRMVGMEAGAWLCQVYSIVLRISRDFRCMNRDGLTHNSFHNKSLETF